MTEQERRKFERLKKKFIVSYHPLDEPNTAFDISQIKDIGLGGMRFVANRAYIPGTPLAIELQTPFIWDRLCLQAKVLESKEIIENLLYDTRVAFSDLDEKAKHYLSKTIEVFKKKEMEEE